MKNRKFYTICAENQHVGKNKKRAMRILVFRVAVILIAGIAFLLLRGSWVTIHWLGAGVVMVGLLLFALVDFFVPKWIGGKLRGNALFEEEK